MNKLYKVLKEYSLKRSAFLVNIQTLSVAAQALPLQPLLKHPELFDPLKKFPPPSTFVYKCIEIYRLPPIFYVIRSPLAQATAPHIPSYSPSHPNTLCLRQNPCWGAVFTRTMAVKP